MIHLIKLRIASIQAKELRFLVPQHVMHYLFGGQSPAMHSLVNVLPSKDMGGVTIGNVGSTVIDTSKCKFRDGC
jgi:hypothetical protein